ncbi:MAG: hypothetical protein RLZZ596_1302 [Pseudomonadota bacterium]|jgi:osmotically-inducible protein OsmY
MKLNTRKLVLALALTGSLTACAPVMIGGAVMGSLVAVDRRTAGIQVEDERIELSVVASIDKNLGDRVHINVTSYNRQVLLTGEVPNARDKDNAQQLASRTENVRLVVNELAVMGKTSLTDRSSDTLITGRVKAALVDAQDIFANAFKVVTERGTVYLMGRVTQREANRATDIARGVSNVKRVVRVFEIISEEELQRLVPKAPEKDKPEPKK